MVIMGSELGAWRIPQIHTALCLPGSCGTDSVPTGCVDLCGHSWSNTGPLGALTAECQVQVQFLLPVSYATSSK